MYACVRACVCVCVRVHRPVNGAQSDYVPQPDLRAASGAATVAPPGVLAAYNCAQVALLSTKTKSDMITNK